MNIQLPKPDFGDPYEYYPCMDDKKTVNHFILRTRLEQTEAAAPNLYKESYNYSTIPVGWNCFGAKIFCQAFNREYCIVQ
jgi:hypothetical protein